MAMEIVSVETLTKGLKYLRTTQNQRGNRVDYWFDGGPERSRYRFDSKPGWVQYDTSQDAWYFGVWVNQSERKILTYAEGDVSVVTCPTVDQFNAEISKLNAFYEAGFIAKSYDKDGAETVYRQDREKFFIRNPWWVRLYLFFTGG